MRSVKNNKRSTQNTHRQTVLGKYKSDIFNSGDTDRKMHNWKYKSENTKLDIRIGKYKSKIAHRKIIIGKYQSVNTNHEILIGGHTSEVQVGKYK